MPLFDYHCSACAADFELLVRGATVPACPHCGSTALAKALSRIAPAGRIEGMRMAMRRQADAAGHFSHYSPAERAKLLKS
jgi:putative FmdB family regulatory protein